MPNFDGNDYQPDPEPRAVMGDLVRSIVDEEDDDFWPGRRAYIAVEDDCPQQVVDILRNSMPIWLDLFQMKSREYGDAAFELGPRAQFVDMNRKFVKLKRALWEGHEEELTTEGIDEILLDLIGHCFLTLEMRRRERSVD